MNKPLIHDANFSQVENFVVTNDEIDLRELFSALWKGKWTIVMTTMLFSIGGVMFALSKPNTYQASAVLVSSSNESTGGLAAMASQFGGLASLAGINVGGGKADQKSLALATLQSRLFLSTIIDKYDMAPKLVAIESWDKQTGELSYDPDVYDGKSWLKNLETPRETFEPTLWEAHKALKNILSVSEAKDTGIVTISIVHISPVVAQKWVELLVLELNQWMKRESLADTNRNIEYLKKQLEKTKVVDMQSVFYQLIEEQTKTLMLAEVKDEFAFKTIDPAVIPEEKFGPKRALICILSTLLGGMLGVAIVLVAFATKRENN